MAPYKYEDKAVKLRIRTLNMIGMRKINRCRERIHFVVESSHGKDISPFNYLATENLFILHQQVNMACQIVFLAQQVHVCHIG